MRMSREQDSKAKASSMDRDDERLKRDERGTAMNGLDDVCMGLVSLFQEVQDFFGRLLFRHAWH